MDVLWTSSDALKPSDVLNRLGSGHAYTTIMTVLKRMSDKKIVSRTKSGNVYLYSPIESKSSFACHCLDDLFSRIIKYYGQHAIDSFRRVSQSLKV